MSGLSRISMVQYDGMLLQNGTPGQGRLCPSLAGVLGMMLARLQASRRSVLASVGRDQHPTRARCVRASPFSQSLTSVNFTEVTNTPRGRGVYSGVKFLTPVTANKPTGAVYWHR